MKKSVSKYKSKKVMYKGMRFDSKKELKRYLVLEREEEQGLISGLQRQVRFELVPKAVNSVTGKTEERAAYYIADFVYTLPTGAKIVEDVKGYRTDTYLLKRKIMRWRYGITIKET